MADRVVNGHKLYLKGNVAVDHEDEEYIFFDVKSGKETYQVEYEKPEGAWRCICTDYNTRHQKAPGSFLCKHILAALFKLAEVRGVGSQVALDVQVKGAVKS